MRVLMILLASSGAPGVVRASVADAADVADIEAGDELAADDQLADAPSDDAREPEAIPPVPQPNDAAPASVPELVPIVPLSPARKPARSDAIAAQVGSEPRSPWLRTPRLIAYSVGAIGLAGLGLGVAEGLDARAAASAYRRASVQLHALTAKRRSEAAAARANVWFAVGGAVVGAAALTLALDAFGAFSGGDLLPDSPAQPVVGVLPVSGDVVGTWAVVLPWP